ncbi:MAG: hypothetical protein ACPL06_03500 [Candidatus Anstonellales archaeon]
MAAKNNNDIKKIKKGICPVCGSKLAHEEGCVECPNCGWSECEIA